jgi:predicted DNA-binding protein (UPF0251 family)
MAASYHPQSETQANLGPLSQQNENVLFEQSRNVRFHRLGEGPLETERIALSQRGRDRLRVLQEVKRKQLTQGEAARRLKISDRNVRRLLVGLRKLGDRAVLHGLRGRPSNREDLYGNKWDLLELKRTPQPERPVI